ncbi:MAG: hypothetical protein PHN51_11980 [Candidatus Nanopelagicales bacterium]|nr:hypothetical protein [Candidatus Nanopelagicales bacterium]
MTTFTTPQDVIDDMNAFATRIGGDDANVSSADADLEIAGIPGEIYGDNVARAVRVIEESPCIWFAYDDYNVGKRFTRRYNRNEAGWEVETIRPRLLHSEMYPG